MASLIVPFWYSRYRSRVCSRLLRAVSRTRVMPRSFTARSNSWFL